MLKYTILIHETMSDTGAEVVHRIMQKVIPKLQFYDKENCQFRRVNYVQLLCVKYKHIILYIYTYGCVGQLLGCA